MRTSFWTSLLDLIAPRRCAICGGRLEPQEALLCADCDNELEKTPFPESPYDNLMARLFWGQFPIEKASAWFYYRSHSDPSKMIYDLKYHGQMLLGEDIGAYGGTLLLIREPMTLELTGFMIRMLKKWIKK